MISTFKTSESRVQLQVITLVIGTPQGTKVFSVDNYNMLVAKAANPKWVKMRSCESFSCPLPCKQSPSFFNVVTQLQFRALDIDNEVRWGVIKLADILI